MDMVKNLFELTIGNEAKECIYSFLRQHSELSTRGQKITTEYKNMEKQAIRLNESKLRKVIKESIKRYLNTI